MTLAIVDLIAILMTIAGLATSLSVLYAKFIKPIKKVIRQVEDNTKNIKTVEEKIALLRAERADDNAFTVEVRGILLESLVAILEGLEQQGCNSSVTEQRKKLITFMSGQVGAKRDK